MNLLSAIYGAVVARRNRLYDERRAEIVRVDAPVVSVGNISAGGTGKTPFVQYLVGELLSLGRRPAVVSRGYGRKSRGQVVVSDGHTVAVSVAEAGDEVLLHAERLPVPVIVDADRAAAARTAVERFGVDVVVVDDGFQHRRLHRDCDIVLVDKATVERPVLLPVGRLREPLSALARAHVVCCVGGVSCAELPPVEGAHGVCIEAATLAGEVYDVSDGRPAAIPQQALAVAGIAHPERFRSTLVDAGWSVAEVLQFADHFTYRREDAERIVQQAKRRGASAIVTTEKDAVKLRSFAAVFAAADTRLLALPVQTAVTRGREQLIDVLSSLF